LDHVLGGLIVGYAIEKGRLTSRDAERTDIPSPSAAANGSAE